MRLPWTAAAHTGDPATDGQTRTCDDHPARPTLDREGACQYDCAGWHGVRERSQFARAVRRHLG
jgi:hypothetical protein